LDRPDGLTRASTRIATLGPVGSWPVGPGTLASALAALLWWALPWPWLAWLGFVAAVTAVGVPVTGRAERALGHDDGRIVIDEVAGMAVALLAAPRTWAGVAAAFALFRVLDIAKPPPLHGLERVPGGWGVMLDDLAYGAVAALLVAGGFALLGDGWR
jgi:phosphatidylglycerophosphatase A